MKFIGCMYINTDFLDIYLKTFCFMSFKYVI